MPAEPESDAPIAAEPKSAATLGRAARWMTKDSRTRRLLVAVAIYIVCTGVFAAVAGPTRLSQHTAFNHYAQLADAWLHGRQDLRNGPPGYAQGNDFAQFQGKTYISFPPFPALLMLPLVALAGSPENFQDGQFLVWLAGLGPALLFLVLERLRQTKRSPRSEREDVALSVLFAFGTVYFFTAVEGTVWFAAHVVGVALSALFVLFALDARRPLAAGVVLACAWMTRPSMLLMGVLFGLEAIRVCCKDGIPDEGTSRERIAETWRRLDREAFIKRATPFLIPIVGSFALASWMNYTRFGNPSPTAFGHEYLSVVWRGRIEHFGLFGYHYLSKNLGTVLTILPWLPPKGAPGLNGAPFQINEHGLALWFTTPLYFWLFRPKAKGWLTFVFAVSALGPCVMDLLYQNSGWRQFGYRFSNDYAVLLFALLAIGARPMGWLFRIAAVWGLTWNLFGAITFDHPEYDRFYFREGTQTVLYQPD